MEWGVAALPAANGKFPQIAASRSTSTRPSTAQVQTGGTITTPGQRITSMTLDDGTKIVEDGAVVAGAPNVNLATTNFTANNGDSYPFNGLPQVAAGVPYQQSLYDFIAHRPGRRRDRGPLPGGRHRPHHHHAVTARQGTAR